MKWFLYRVFSILLELLVKGVIATFDPPGVAVAQEEERFGTNWKDGGLIPGSYWILGLDTEPRYSLMY